MRACVSTCVRDLQGEIQTVPQQCPVHTHSHTHTHTHSHSHTLVAESDTPGKARRCPDELGPYLPDVADADFPLRTARNRSPMIVIRTPRTCFVFSLDNSFSARFVRVHHWTGGGMCGGRGKAVRACVPVWVRAFVFVCECVCTRKGVRIICTRKFLCVNAYASVIRRMHAKMFTRVRLHVCVRARARMCMVVGLTILRVR